LKINKTKLYENFIDIKNIGNFKIMICYKILFNIKGIIYNIAFYLNIIILIFHFIAIIIFYTKQKHEIYKKIKDIIFGIYNWEFVLANEKQNNIFEKKKVNKIRNKNKKKLKKRKSKNKNNELIRNKKDKIYTNHFIENKLNKGNNPPKKRQNLLNLNFNNQFNNINKNIIKRNLTRKKSVNSTRNILNEAENKENIIKKSKEIMEYNDFEKNDLTYELALKYDKRTFCEFYLSLPKTKHILIFSFCYNNDYNSRIIKIDLFFISFAIDYTVNAFFFNDDTMHKIYVDEGSFNFIYQLPQIIYSLLISSILNIILNLIALSEGDIIKFKKNKNKSDIDRRQKYLKKKINIKFILYFIIGIIFNLFFWYYLSIFCAVYRNTQYHLIKDTLISFGLSLIYPFGIYLLPGIFRIPALSNPKNKRSYLYKLSQFFQIF